MFSELILSCLCYMIYMQLRVFNCQKSSCGGLHSTESLEDKEIWLMTRQVFESVISIRRIKPVNSRSKYKVNYLNT
jgi:hypothetical protein